MVEGYGSREKKAINDLPLGTLVEGGWYVGDIKRLMRRTGETPSRPGFFLGTSHQSARAELRPACDLIRPSLSARAVCIIGAATPTGWFSLAGGSCDGM